VGPDITGANRTDLAYLLETIVDPNAVIPNEYRTTEVETKDGRSLTGIQKLVTEKTLMLQTANELAVLSKDDVASQRLTELSMMPEGLLTPLPDQVGSTVVTVSVGDGTATATETFTLTVNPVNDAPTVSAIADEAVLVNGTITIPFTIGDVDHEGAAGGRSVSLSSRSFLRFSSLIAL
jgi:putative heme-binding domain-containing protein